MFFEGIHYQVVHGPSGAFASIIGRVRLVGLRNTQSGSTWENIQDFTSELLMFQLPPSKTAWCLLLTERKRIYLTIDDVSRDALIDKIKKSYFTIDDNWTYFDGSFFLKNLILSAPDNNY